MDLTSARTLAIALGYQLMPFCEKLNIAGSIRRKKPQVKDIELVCIPKKHEVPGPLFAPPTLAILPAFRDVVASLGTVVKGKPEGKYMQIDLHQGIVLDLFMPDDFDYYRQYAIRTGSAEYSAKVIAKGWNDIGWCGSDKGLRPISACQQRISGGNKTWICQDDQAPRPPVWQSEEEFFDWLGVTWIKPECRNV